MGAPPPARGEPASERTSSSEPAPFRGPAGLPAVDLTGEWNLTNTIERTSYAPYEGLKLGFRLYLKQVGSTVVGTGEKVQEDGERLPPEARSPLQLEGVLRDGRLEATFVEHGRRRMLSGSFDWEVLFDGRVVRGRFAEATANSRGSSTGFKVE